MCPALVVPLMVVASAVRCGQSPVADDMVRARARMVAEQIEARGIHDPKVLAAMREVPRDLFVPSSSQSAAYEDRPLSIGHGQTISQPYIVALMTELARPRPSDRALEIGTGSGYQAAVLSRLVRRVFTIEIVEPLAREAEERLRQHGFSNVVVRSGDGYAGWPEEAPFDIVLVTAAPDHVPPPLVQQLRPGGRLVIPVGSADGIQELRLLEKDVSGRMRTTSIAPVRFVPFRRK